MGGKHNKCCCGGGAGSYLLYAIVNELSGGAAINGKLLEFDPETGTLLRTLYTDSNKFQDVCCDPLTGNIYIAHSTSSTSSELISVDANGSLLWASSVSATSEAGGVAVAADGYVYCSTVYPTSEVHKFNASTGAEETSGWPYVWAIPTGGIPQGEGIYQIAADQSGNIYGGGFARIGTGFPVDGYRAFKIAATGSLLWQSKAGANYAAGDYGARGISVNAAGAQLALGNHCTGGAGTKSVHHLNASTGAVITSVLRGSQQNRCAYGHLANSYIGGIADASLYTVNKDLAVYYKSGQVVYGLAIGNTGDEFVSGQGSGAAGSRPLVRSITYGWVYYDSAGKDVSYGLETSQGRIGAFGL